MAFLLDDEREDALDDGTGQPSGAPVGGGGGGGSGDSQKGAQEKPTRFVSFDRYFNANAGAANKLADRIASGVEQQAQSARSAVDNARNTFRQQVQTGSSVAPAVVNSFAGGYDPYSYTAASYSGPQAFGEGTDLAPIQSQIETAQNSLNQLDDAAGIQTFLKDYAGGHTPYSDQMSRMDAAFTQRAGHDRFTNLWNQFSGLSGSLDAARVEGADLVTQARADVDAKNRAARDQANALNTQANKDWEESMRRAEEERLRIEREQWQDQMRNPYDSPISNSYEDLKPPKRDRTMDPGPVRRTPAPAPAPAPAPTTDDKPKVTRRSAPKRPKKFGWYED